MKFLEKIKSIPHSMAERPSSRMFVASNSTHRKVLIAADEPTIKNLLALVRKLDSRRVVTSKAGLDLSSINRRSFDTAILDMRCLQGRPASRGYGFGEVWPSMTGRVLVINAEVNDLKTLQLAERFIYHRRSLDALLLGVASRFRSFVDRSPSPNHI